MQLSFSASPCENQIVQNTGMAVRPVVLSRYHMSGLGAERKQQPTYLNLFLYGLVTSHHTTKYTVDCPAWYSGDSGQ
jgi:hypothetical protein